MGRKTSVSRAVVIDVFRRLMAAMENPAPLDLSGLSDGVDCDIPDVDLLIDSLGPMPVLEVESIPTTGKVPEYVMGTKHVSIRIPNRVVNAFKAEATKSGKNYQTLMNRILADAAEKFAL